MVELVAVVGKAKVGQKGTKKQKDQFPTSHTRAKQWKPGETKLPKIINKKKCLDQDKKLRSSTSFISSFSFVLVLFCWMEWNEPMHPCVSPYPLKSTIWVQLKLESQDPSRTKQEMQRAAQMIPCLKNGSQELLKQGFISLQEL
uniref:Uncharacterized protein n=1 Tax=Lactuca sativa TaxID=4236 RepID=A0A9R1XNT2_LACSA|nr:hypothetical protein LSAT_V11C300155340 [Lactuca sativa]